MSVQAKRSRRLPSLAASLTVAFLGLSVVALLVAGGFQLYFSIRAQRESVARQQQFIAQDAANAVVSFVQEKFTLLGSVAELSDPRVALLEERERHLRSLLGLEPAFRHLVLLDAQGRSGHELSSGTDRAGKDPETGRGRCTCSGPAGKTIRWPGIRR